jgi:hypothetical protein
VLSVLLGLAVGSVAAGSFDSVFLPYRRAASRTEPTSYEESQHVCLLLWQQRNSKVTAQQHFEVADGGEENRNLQALSFY